MFIDAQVIVLWIIQCVQPVLRQIPIFIESMSGKHPCKHTDALAAPEPELCQQHDVFYRIGQTDCEYRGTVLYTHK